MINKYTIMQKKSRQIVMLLLVFFFVNSSIIGSTTALNNKENGAIADDFDEEIIQLMNEEGIQSISACIIKNNSIIWSKGYGYYNKIPRKTPTLDTIYMACSITKTFTSTAMMQIIESSSHDVSLDDDINKFLPFEVRNPNHPEIPITIRMLLSHQSSLNWSPSNDLFKLGPFFYLRMHARNIFFDNILLKFVFKQYLQPDGILYHPRAWNTSKPGEGFHYSDLGFDLLTYIIEIITDMRYDVYCEKNIFEPLDMKNTSFNYKNLPKNQHANPYIHIGKNIVIPLKKYNIPYYGSGAIHTTAEDLSHFLIAHMNNGTYEDVQILNSTNIQSMHTVFYPRENVNSSGIYNFQYGLGWCVWNNSENIYEGHFGSYFGADSFMTYQRSDKTGVILFIDTFLGFYPLKNRTETNEEFTRQMLYDRAIHKKFYEKADEL